MSDWRAIITELKGNNVAITHGVIPFLYIYLCIDTAREYNAWVLPDNEQKQEILFFFKENPGILHFSRIEDAMLNKFSFAKDILDDLNSRLIRDGAAEFDSK